MNHPGLSWTKHDLHVHTPGSSFDYSDNAKTPEEIISSAISAGMQGIAITDHNTGEWVDRVKTAARQTGLTVFPGVEITVSGGPRNIHILGIFDPSKSSAHINDLLSRLHIPVEKRGKPEALASGNVSDVIDTIDACDGIPLLAHADSTGGVIADMSGEPRTSVIRNPRLLGAQIKHTKTAKFLDGSDPTYQRVSTPTSSPWRSAAGSSTGLPSIYIPV